MIVNCPSCMTKYQFEESRFGANTSKRLKCAKCETVFEVTKPEIEASEVRRTAVAAPAPDRPTGDGEVSRPSPAPDLSNLPHMPPLPSNKRYSLAVIMGTNAGQIHTVSKPRIILGRAADSDVQLQDSEVSRRHAMLEIHLDEGSVVDLGSTNGTYVDGVRIQRATIYSNQEFSLGTTTLMFIVTDVPEGGAEQA